MTKQLLDRVAIVTGASNGIGRGIAEALAAAGAKTALAARRTEMLEDVASGIRNAGGTALPLTTDVTREDQVVRLFKTTYETYGRVDVLVNNAGVPTHVPVEDITLKYWQEVLDVNLTAAFLCSREAVRIMKSQTPQGGRIINIGSVSAKTPRPDSLPYTATKFALQGNDAAIDHGRPQVRRRCVDLASGRDAQQLFDSPRPDEGRAGCDT
jgi:NAD(P)-dependent dehydrogenase (short-subunit alcohol dehydrogenase family)